MNLEEFSYQFGVNGAENLISKLNQIESETEDLDNAVKHLGNTFQKFFDYALRSAIPPAFIKMVMDQAMAFSKQAEYIERLAQTSGISTRTIQQFGYALHRFGGDVTTATTQLDHLQTQFEKFKKPISKGGGIASELARLSKLHRVDLRGVTSAVDLLKAISVRMEKLSERKKLELARAFGLDDSTFLMVKNGLKSLEESLYKAQKFVLFDDKEIRQAKEFEDTLRDIADNITLISKSFSFGAIPEMQKFANVMRKVTDFMSEHKEVVKGIGMTSFGAGAYGIFRLLNLLPTKFLKASAGVFGSGFAIGTINEEVDKLNRGKRENTYIGDLEKLGFNKSAKYLELIFRAVHDLTNNKSLEGLKNLSDLIGKELNIPFLQKENIEQSQKNAESIFAEYKDAFKKYGLTGIVARTMTSGDTLEERAKDFKKNKEEIENEGGVFPFLWKKIESIFTELKNTLTSKDFWVPIFDKINSLLDYLKSIFYDLVIFVKQQAGIELSKSDKAHILKKQLKQKEQESINEVIKSVSSEITDLMTSDDDLIEKKNKIQQRVSDLSSQITDTFGSSIYSKESVAAKLLFEGSKGVFEQKKPELMKNVESLTSYIKDLGLEALATKDQISQIYDEYKTQKQQEITNSAESLKATIDISDIIGDKKIDNIDVSNVSLQDFIDKVSPLLSKDQNDEALARYKYIVPKDSLMNALTLTEKSPSSMKEFLGNFGEISGVFGNVINLMKSLFNMIDGAKSPLLNRIKITNKDSDLLKSIENGDTQLKDLSFFEVFKEFISSEWDDFYRNWLSIDKAVERIGKLIEESADLIASINGIIVQLKEKIQGYLRIGGATLGISIGSKFGPKGAVIGGLLGLIMGDKAALELSKDRKDEKGKRKEYGYLDYVSERIDKAWNWLTSSGNPQQDKLNKLNTELSSLKVQLGESDTDVLTNALLDLIKKKEEEIAKAQAILEGSKNIQSMGNTVAANSNSPLVNNNSQDNVININQSINVNKTNATPEDIAGAALKGTRDGIDQGLLGATNYRAVGNSN